MFIASFKTFIQQELCQPHTLTGSVVIDGINFFYKTYEDSQLCYTYGPESDNYATYLRHQISQMKKAKLNCYFIFKAGQADYTKRLNKNGNVKRTQYIEKSDSQNETVKHFTPPNFMTQICLEVLEEYGFKYGISDTDNKRDCIALAKLLDCPIISCDIEYLFSGVPYISHETLSYDHTTNTYTCGIAHRRDIEQEFNIDVEKIAIFVTLTDAKIFVRDYFLEFLQTLRINVSHYKRIEGIFNWLRGISKEEAIAQIFEYIDEKNQQKFIAAKDACLKLMNQNQSRDILELYLEKDHSGIIQENDPKWFQKGVTLGHIPPSYVNIYRWKYIRGSWAIQGRYFDNALLLSVDIIRYAYDLLTNFEGEELTFTCKTFEIKDDYEIEYTKKIPITSERSVARPDEQNVFVNGWHDIVQLGLFQHFLSHQLPGIDFSLLELVQDDAKILFISLIYFYHKKNNKDVTKEIYSIILSYVALNCDDWDKKKINEILSPYLRTSGDNQLNYNPNVLHPLVEFQHCLENLNSLNKLCGSCYPCTVYNKTYNGTLIYNLAFKMANDGGGEREFVNKLLYLAPKANDSFNKLANMYHKIVAMASSA